MKTSQTKAKKVTEIKQLDLTYLVNRLVKKENWEQTAAQEAVRRYKNFLILRLKYPTARFVPTEDIDAAWHAHILYTTDYTRDCHAFFGGYLHHQPADDSDEKASEAMEKQYYAAAALYREEFNEPYSLTMDVGEFW